MKLKLVAQSKHPGAKIIIIIIITTNTHISIWRIKIADVTQCVTKNLCTYFVREINECASQKANQLSNIQFIVMRLAV